MEYDLPEAAQLALEQMNGVLLGGRNIKVCIYMYVIVFYSFFEKIHVGCIELCSLSLVKLWQLPVCRLNLCIATLASGGSSK